jgi:hypothetical protein
MGLGSGKKPIPDPGSGASGQKGTGSRIPGSATLLTTILLIRRFVTQNIKKVDPQDCIFPKNKLRSYLSTNTPSYVIR